MATCSTHLALLSNVVLTFKNKAEPSIDHRTYMEGLIEIKINSLEILWKSIIRQSIHSLCINISLFLFSIITPGIEYLSKCCAVWTMQHRAA